MPNCKKCGSPMRDSERFCALCGTPVSVSTSSDSQSSDNSNPNDLSNKSLDELKALARSGNVDAAFIVGSHYANEEDNIVAADKWFELTYSGRTVHILGLRASMLSKHILFKAEVDLSKGFNGYSADRFYEIVNEYTVPAKKIVSIWQQNNQAFDAEYYKDAMEFLSSINLYLGRVLMRQDDRESKVKAMNCFYGCTNAKFLESTRKFIANLGYCTCDMVLDESKSSATNKANNAYNYFLQNKKHLNRDLDMAEEYIVFMFGIIVSEYIEADISDSFIPYLKNEIYRRNFLKNASELNEKRNGLLYQLEMCATGLTQFEQNNERIRELNNKMFKSAAIKNEIAQLEEKNSQLANQFAPFLKTYIPKDYWLSSYIIKMRDFVRGGHVKSLQEALSMIRMEEQAEHERYMDMVMRAETWRRKSGF